MNDERFRKEITPLMVAAETCLSDYQRRNPVLEAKKQASYDNPLFFYNYYSGVAEGTQGTGIGCSPDQVNGAEPGWQELNTYQSIMGDGDSSTEYIDKCNHAAIAYGTLYNQKLAALRPDALAKVCKGPEL